MDSLPAVSANAPFRLLFDARRSGEGGVFWAQWLSAAGAELGPRMMIEVAADDRWHPGTLRGVTPAVAPGDGSRLHFVLVWPARTALLGNLRLYQKPSLQPDQGTSARRGK